MAAKKTKEEVKGSLEETQRQAFDAINTVLEDNNTGAKLIVSAEMDTFLDTVQVYTSALFRTRDIMSQDNLDSSTPIMQFVYNALYADEAPAEGDELDRRIKHTKFEVYRYFDQHQEIASGNAVMLAMTTKNVFPDPPTPYDDEVTELPGIITIPPPDKDISNPRGVEYRFKQLMDYLNNNPNLGFKFIDLVQNVGVRLIANLNEQAKVAGFQSSGTN